MCEGRCAAVRREVIQKGPDVVFVEVAGMGGVMEANEVNDPPHVRLLRMVSVLATPARLPCPVEKFGRLIVGVGHGDRPSAPTQRLA